MAEGFTPEKAQSSRSKEPVPNEPAAAYYSNEERRRLEKKLFDFARGKYQPSRPKGIVYKRPCVDYCRGQGRCKTEREIEDFLAENKEFKRNTFEPPPGFVSMWDRKRYREDISAKNSARDNDSKDQPGSSFHDKVKETLEKYLDLPADEEPGTVWSDEEDIPPIGHSHDPKEADTIKKVRWCKRKGCKSKAVSNPDWDNEYCSTECVVLHCGKIFELWKSQNPDAEDFEEESKQETKDETKEESKSLPEVESEENKFIPPEFMEEVF